MPNESHLPAGTPADTNPPAPARGPGYEVRDANVRAIVYFVVGLTALIFVVQVGLYYMLRGMSGEDPRAAVAEAAASVAAAATSSEAPAVLVGQLHKLREHEAEVLEGPARLVDPKKGTVRIPVEEAIDVLAERGLPPTPGPPRTEVEVNSHSGSPAPASPDKTPKAGPGGGPKS